MTLFSSYSLLYDALDVTGEGVEVTDTRRFRWNFAQVYLRTT